MKLMDQVLQIVARVFVFLFLTGVIGSMVVVMISFVEDLELLVESDDEPSVDAAGTRA